jgi:hypothetical protein
VYVAIMIFGLLLHADLSFAASSKDANAASVLFGRFETVFHLFRPY